MPSGGASLAAASASSVPIPRRVSVPKCAVPVSVEEISSSRSSARTAAGCNSTALAAAPIGDQAEGSENSCAETPSRAALSGLAAWALSQNEDTAAAITEATAASAARASSPPPPRISRPALRVARRALIASHPPIAPSPGLGGSASATASVSSSWRLVKVPPSGRGICWPEATKAARQSARALENAQLGSSGGATPPPPAVQRRSGLAGLGHVKNRPLCEGASLATPAPGSGCAMATTESRAPARRA
mmetsp:Transcript_1549/g.6149  ORF Transcript_1549/g.6149 Transcript_1549/m.6149 type:complete len:248 (-) Transcript_1549:1460-2203(-)